MTLALLFPGQGTQHADMLAWLAVEPGASPMLARLAADLGADWHSRLPDTAWSTDNRVAQTLITGLSLAAWQALSPHLPAPTVIAGYSVGELPAFAAAGVFDAATAMDLARLRASLMSASVHGQATGLLAVSGLSFAAREGIGQRYGLTEAIRLGPDRAVLGGVGPALDDAAAAFVSAGALATRLAVRVASHTPWVAGAVSPFESHLHTLRFAAPQALLACNRTGAAARGEAALKSALASQIDHPVLWDRCMDTLEESRVDCVLEIGPGSTLSKLWNERGTGVPARSVDEFRSASAIVRWAEARGA
jgi:[acyl-carrier-protein] S-malonyltransferase